MVPCRLPQRPGSILFQHGSDKRPHVWQVVLKLPYEYDLIFSGLFPSLHSVTGNPDAGVVRSRDYLKKGKTPSLDLLLITF
jgi:hypothetical protein